MVTGLVCGQVPAFAALRTNVNANLKEGGRSGSDGGGHARLRSTLVVAEIAIALVLLTASSLLLRSFEKMRSVDLGYRPEHVTTASYSLPQRQYEKQSQIDEFNRELLRRLDASPGLAQRGWPACCRLKAALTIRLSSWTGISRQGREHEPRNGDAGDRELFSNDGIPLLRGRFSQRGTGTVRNW